jgi:hypothetical protein
VTKADVVLCDIDFIDNTVMEATLSEPSEMSSIQAPRNALSKLYLESPDEELETLKARQLLLRTVTKLRTATLSHYAGKIRLISEYELFSIYVDLFNRITEKDITFSRYVRYVFHFRWNRSYCCLRPYGRISTIFLMLSPA